MKKSRRSFANASAPVGSSNNKMKEKNNKQQNEEENTDIDYLYDPYPLVEHDVKPIFSRKLMKPTHTSYNLAFSVPQEICKDVIKFIIKEGGKINPSGFRNFIGVRNINSSCDLVFSGNYGKKVSSIDLYSNPEDTNGLYEASTNITCVLLIILISGSHDSSNNNP